MASSLFRNQKNNEKRRETSKTDPEIISEEKRDGGSGRAERADFQWACDDESCISF